jgi:FG-GAP-like repeat
MTQSRIIALVIAFLFSATASRSQTYVFGRASFPVGKEPNSLILGDFNGDGINDIGVVNSVDNTVSILPGKSDGTFIPQVTYATGTAPGAIATGDFNGDGNLDLAVTNGGCVLLEGSADCGDGHTISILLGNGDGTFQDHVDYTTGTYPTSLTVADFNADGILDLAIANASDGTVSILLGIGDAGHLAESGLLGQVSLPWQRIAIRKSPTEAQVGRFLDKRVMP